MPNGCPSTDLQLQRYIGVACAHFQTCYVLTPPFLRLTVKKNRQILYFLSQLYTVKYG